MAYTKQTWATGDTITAAKLNHMEDGIEVAGGGGYDLVVRMSTMVPTSLTACTVVDGLGAGDLYDLMQDGGLATVMVYGTYNSGVFYEVEPFLCQCRVHSQPDVVELWNILGWGSGVYLEYTSNGVSVQFV